MPGAFLARPEPATAQAPWWFAWAATRIVVVALVSLGRDSIGADPHYYLVSLARASHDGWDTVLPEYPLPVVLVLWPLHLVAEAGVAAWLVVLVPLVVVDLAFTTVLHRHAGPQAVRCWVWGVLLMGPLAFQRLDLLAGVLLAGVLLAPTPPARGVLLALGTSAKVFPLLVLGLVSVTARRPVRVVWWTLVPGAALAAACVLVSDVDRLLSPLRYQSSRGLQLESVAATPFMVARLWEPARWTTSFAASKSWEVAGPGTGGALGLTTAGLVLVLAGVLGASIALARRRPQPVAGGEDAVERCARDVVSWGVLATVCVLISTSRVLSPQYLLWLLPVVAAALARPTPELRRWARGFMAALLLTQLLFPALYGGLVSADQTPWPATVVLVARNVLLVLLSIEAVRRAARALRSWTRLHEEQRLAGRQQPAAPG